MVSNLTRGNPAKLILLFTIPYLIGNIFQQFYNIADTVVVGRTVGITALAAVGAAGSILNLCLNIIGGFTTGFCILIAQKMGAEDYLGMKKSFAMSIVISAVITVVFTAGFIIFAKPLLHLIQTPDEIFADSYAYLIIIFAGLFATMLFNLLSNAVRALGDSRTPLIFLAIACVINVVLDLVFILFFQMGVMGVALATVIAQLISGLLCLLHIKKHVYHLHLKKSDFKIDMNIISQLFKIGFPMALLNALISIGSVTVQSAMNSLGTDYVAAYSAAGKIESISLMPIMSFGSACAMYAAQNYGAKDRPRIIKGINSALLMCFIWNMASITFMGLAGKWLIGLILSSDATDVIIGYAYTYLVICVCFETVLSPLVIYKASVQSFGCAVLPTLSGILELICRMTASLYLSQVFGFVGVCFANPITWTLTLFPIGIEYFYMLRKFKKDPTFVRAIN